MSIRRIILAGAIILAVVGIASPASADPGGTIENTDVIGCTFEVTVTTEDPGDYAVSIWDDGTELGEVIISPTVSGQRSVVYFTITGPILQGASGLGLYLENGDNSVLFDSETADFWSAEVGNDCAENPPPAVSVIGDPGEVVEGGPSGSFVFSLTEPATAETLINYSVSGDAVSGTDFTPLATAVIPAGETSVSVLVTPLDDGAVSGSRDVIVSATPGVQYVMGDPLVATIAIIDQSGEPTTTTTTTAAPTTTVTVAPVTTPRFTG